MRHLRIVFLMAMLTCANIRADLVSAGPCLTLSLASYIALGSAGCEVPYPGAPGFLGYRDFSFSVISSGGGAVPLTASQITVTPVTGAMSGLNFSSTGFSVTGTQFVSYLLGYTIDPSPPVIHELWMLTHSPVFPGIATITLDNCVGSAFAGVVCPTSPVVTESVFDNGITASLMDQQTLTGATNLIGVRTTISLAANGASANFSSYNDFFVPEPGTFLGAGAGFIFLWFYRRVFRAAHRKRNPCSLGLTP